MGLRLALVVPQTVDAGLRRVLLGYSHEGRPIKAYRLGDPASENARGGASVAAAKVHARAVVTVG